MLLIFILMNFLIKHHLSKDKQKDLTPIKFTEVKYFSQLQQVNTRSGKLESQFYHFPSSSYVFYKIAKNLKALIQLHLILPEKISETVHLIFFYQILHFMRNPTKFGSPKLDTPSLRYEFFKHAFKSVKTNQKIK